MKRFAAIILTVLLGVSLAGCHHDQKSEQGNTSESKVESGVTSEESGEVPEESSEISEESSGISEESGEIPEEPSEDFTEPGEIEEPEETQVPAEFSFSGTTFYYDGQSYDLAARTPSVNAIISVFPVGDRLVIESHIGPKNGMYTIFDTEKQEFEADLFGSNLVWLGDDLETAVYAFWGEIYAYDGTLIQEYDLAENEFISDLTFSDDESTLIVTISKNDGSRQVDEINLQVS